MNKDYNIQILEQQLKERLEKKSKIIEILSNDREKVEERFNEINKSIWQYLQLLVNSTRKTLGLKDSRGYPLFLKDSLTIMLNYNSSISIILNNDNKIYIKIKGFSKQTNPYNRELNINPNELEFTEDIFSNNFTNVLKDRIYLIYLKALEVFEDDYMRQVLNDSNNINLNRNEFLELSKQIKEGDTKKDGNIY